MDSSPLPTFKDAFPNFEFVAAFVFSYSCKIAFIITVVALLSVGWSARKSPEQMLTGLLQILVVICLIASWNTIAGFDGWIRDFAKGFKEEANRATGGDNYATQVLLATLFKTIKDLSSFVSFLANPFPALMACLAALCCVCARGVMWICEIFQGFYLGLLYCLAPIFLAALCLNSTRSIGITFITTTITVATYSVGWALVDVGTYNLLSAYQVKDNTFALILLCGWPILGYAAVPYIMGKIWSGHSPGAALTGSVVGMMATLVGGAKFMMGGKGGGGGGGASSGGGKTPSPDSPSSPSSPGNSPGGAPSNSPGVKPGTSSTSSDGGGSSGGSAGRSSGGSNPPWYEQASAGGSQTAGSSSGSSSGASPAGGGSSAPASSSPAAQGSTGGSSGPAASSPPPITSAPSPAASFPGSSVASSSGSATPPPPAISSQPNYKNPAEKIRKTEGDV